MRWEKAGVVAALFLVLAPGPAMAAQEAAKAEAEEGGRVAVGTVTAITLESRTVVVESRLGRKPWILGVEVPKTLEITAGGKTKKLEELKAGERIRLRWARDKDRLMAESIAVIGTKAP